MQYKKGVKISLIILCMLVLLFAAGCNSQEDAAQSHGMSFRENSVTVEKYETCTLELQGAEGKQIEWKSNDESVATVQDGVVCGWKKGNTQILACVDGVEVSCNIIVTDNQYVPVLKLRDSDELALDLGGTYSLQPVLYYNAKEYTEVQYTYFCVGNAVTVDENGVIHAAEAGEAMVCVQGEWRGNVVDASLTVYVIDVSTAVEVSGKAFDIYLNSRDEEFPASADLGISVFDKDTPVQEKDASIKYIELIMAGDVAGAATVENGVVYSKKLGTTHFVAEYTPAEGEAVRTTVFTVNVHKCPADIYMEPIAGAEYESFITPLNAINSVKWDEEMGAFHLTNKNAEHNDGRAFLFSGDYIEKILRYTNAKSLVFEVKGDGIHSGIQGADQYIYQGFYPDWYDAGEYLTLGNTDEWQKIEVFFDDIPMDQNGKRKSIMLLSSVEGMYIRNIRPMTEGSFLTMDLEFTTLGGSWGSDVEIGLYPHSYEGGINDYNNRVTIKSGVTTTVKVRLDDFLEGGVVPGFGLVVYGGPAWDAKLPDGYTPDRHTLKISNLRVTGEQNYSLDLSTASWATGKDGTGFTDANGSGIPSYEDGAIIITNGFQYDGHKFTLDSEEAKNRTYLYLDMQIDTLGGDWTGDIEVRFYPHNFEGNPHEVYGDKLVLKAGKQTTVKLDASDYLVDGKLTGIGVGIFGGPAWDAKLPDGYTPDRHTVTLSNVRLEGALNETFDLSRFEMLSGTKDTGYTVANGSGTAELVDGAIVITNGFCYDCHKITFDSGKSQETKTYVMMDMQIDTLGGDWTNDIELRFYPHNFEGNPHEDYADKVIFKAGQQQTVKLNAEKYLVDGELPGIGIGIFGGPEWNTQISDGVYDRHTVTITGVRLEGEQNETIGLNGFEMTSGTVDTGYTEANGSGTAELVDGAIVITNGFCYDCHKITFAEAQEPPAEGDDTYLTMDMLLTTLGGSSESVEIRMYNYNYEGSVGDDDYTDLVTVTAGTTTKIKVKADNYLVDGKLPGFGFAVMGGPEWNTQLADGTHDRHSIVLSNVRLEGAQEQSYDLNSSTVATGMNGTGFTWANSGGIASIADGELVIIGGFRYDAHELTLAEAQEPPVEETDTYVVLDMLLTTLGGSSESVEIRLYNYNYEGSVGDDDYTDLVTVTAGITTKIKVKADNYLVDGKLPGFGFAVMGGPEWNTQLADGTHDRHSIVLSNVRLEGAQEQSYDLNSSTVATGMNGTGFTWANSGGIASIADGELVIIGGFRYDAHELTLAEAQEPPVEETDTYVVLDMQIDTLGGNWTNDIEIRFYNYGFEGNPHETYTDKVIFKAGEMQTVKLEAEKYLVDGELPGIGIGIFGGPAWDAKLPDGYTPDRHTVTISNVKLEGEQSAAYDLNKSVVTSGTDGTGFTGVYGPGVVTIGESIVLSDGFQYYAHKISLVEKEEPGETEQDTYVVLDMQFDTLGGNWTNDIEIRFYAYGFEGNAHQDYTDSLIFKDGEKQTVKLEAEKYLVDGKLPGIGVCIFGGPAWDAKLPDGYTPDRHTVTISNVHLEGAEATVYDLSQSVVTSGTSGTGYTTDIFGPGVITVGNEIVLSDGFRYFGHKISLTEKAESGDVEQDPYLVLDMQIDTKGGNWSKDIEIRFYPYDFAGNPHEAYTDKVIFKAGEMQTVKLDAEKYLVDGELTGIGIGIFGGPEWNTQIAPGNYDRHTVTISSVKLEGAAAKEFDLSQSTMTSGTVDTGYTVANGSGVGAFADGVYQITNGFCYDCHKISLTEKAESGETEQETYIVMDLLLTTLSNSTNPVEIRFCNYNQEDSVHTTYTDMLHVTAGTKTTVRLKVDNYLVDGELPGFSIGIFGGPEWNTQISAGVYDRHSVVISDLRLEGAGARDIDLSAATVATGIPGSNSGGSIAIVDSQIVITGGFRYDGHRITLG